MLLPSFRAILSVSVTSTFCSIECMILTVTAVVWMISKTGYSSAIDYCQTKLQYYKKDSETLPLIEQTIAKLQINFYHCFQSQIESQNQCYKIQGIIVIKIIFKNHLRFLRITRGVGLILIFDEYKIQFSHSKAQNQVGVNINISQTFTKPPTPLVYP